MITRDRQPDPETPLSENSVGEIFDDVAERFLSRRTFLQGAAGVGTLVIGAGIMQASTETASASGRLDFRPIQPDGMTVDREVVADGYRSQVLIRWGDPITANAPEWNPEALDADAQKLQFGYNCDYVGYMPLPMTSSNPDRGLLVVNHEYTNEELMFRGYNRNNPTRTQIDVGIAAHGVTVVEVVRGADRRWRYVRNSPFNTRLTGFTAMLITGPAAGHPWMITSTDPTGTVVEGTLNNCAGGRTPWGTVLTAEENFHQYFGNTGLLPATDPRRAVHVRYGMPMDESQRKWERAYSRFDVSREPNEAFRFGWIVELDPYNPNWTPRKRTALGRFKHEAATFATSFNGNGRVAFYSGDDERFEYVYKFVSAGRFNPDNRFANTNLLENGILYAARFNDDGTGEWLPLVFGRGPLTPANGFNNQGDVLIQTRRAADLLGATRMDRPEDIEQSPTNGRIYIILTFNERRGTPGNPGVNAANPVAENRNGHIIELVEDGDDVAATTFRWNMFMVAGNPRDPFTFFAGFPKDRVSIISAPDNLTFDMDGNMWISTDGMQNIQRLNDGLFVVPTDGPERGFVRQFYSAVAGAEICGPEFTPDNTAIFLAIQHPGEGGTVERPVSRFPDGLDFPRPSVVVLQANNGSRIGMSQDRPVDVSFFRPVS